MKFKSNQLYNVSEIPSLSLSPISLTNGHLRKRFYRSFSGVTPLSDAGASKVSSSHFLFFLYLSTLLIPPSLYLPFDFLSFPSFCPSQFTFSAQSPVKLHWCWQCPRKTPSPIPLSLSLLPLSHRFEPPFLPPDYHRDHFQAVPISLFSPCCSSFLISPAAPFYLSDQLLPAATRAIRPPSHFVWLDPYCFLSWKVKGDKFSWS